MREREMKERERDEGEAHIAGGGGGWGKKRGTQMYIVLNLKNANTILEMQSCHNDVRAMTPCFYVSNEGATLGLSRAI